MFDKRYFLGSCLSIALTSCHTLDGGEISDYYFGVVKVERTIDKSERLRFAKVSTLGTWSESSEHGVSVGIGWKQGERVYSKKECHVTIIIENETQVQLILDLLSAEFKDEETICYVKS